MLILSLLCAALPLSRVLAGQIPEVDGILGGVPHKSSPARRSAPPLGGHNASSVIPGKLRVMENSGVCETTSGVYQASGYADLAHNQSMWFWFFAARESAHTAPLALWFNGGPGSSSMIGLFQEHGPCRITNDSSSVVPNLFSWNNNANVLYIDQPIGAGFSHGELLVNTSQHAAADVWQFLQIFFSDLRFAEYQSRPLALWTESYGGHYGPTFAAHFLRQNADIESGFVEGRILNLKVLGIGDGLTDPLAQYPGYIQYATKNLYRVLDSPSQLASANSSLEICKKRILACYNGSEFVCSNAQDFCNTHILGALVNDWNPYDVRSPRNDSYPPSFDDYINNVRNQIGAEVPFVFSSPRVYSNFVHSGDWMRNSAPDLEFVINKGIHTLIYAGDADFVVNYIGVEAMVDRLQTQFSSAYKDKAWKAYNVSGQPTGQYKKADNFAYLRIFGAGHEVPAYTYGSLQHGQAALQFFNQVTLGGGLCSTDGVGDPVDC